MGVLCFLQLGTNKGDKFENLERAKYLIKSIIGNIISESSVYETEPWGYLDDETYLNQVIKVETQNSPKKLLKNCLDIESRLGRTRLKNEYEPRTMDIDILFYENEIIQQENLEIPHPRLHERMFVLSPLMEIEPDYTHPGLHKTIQELHKTCTDKGWIKRIKNPSSE